MEIYNFKAFAVILSDQSMWADVLLQDFTLEDTRSIRKSGVTRFVTSKKKILQHLKVLFIYFISSNSYIFTSFGT